MLESSHLVALDANVAPNADTIGFLLQSSSGSALTRSAVSRVRAEQGRVSLGLLDARLWSWKTNFTFRVGKDIWPAGTKLAYPGCRVLRGWVTPAGTHQLVLATARRGWPPGSVRRRRPLPDTSSSAWSCCSDYAARRESDVDTRTVAVVPCPMPPRPGGRRSRRRKNLRVCSRSLWWHVFNVPSSRENCEIGTLETCRHRLPEQTLRQVTHSGNEPFRLTLRSV